MPDLLLKIHNALPGRTVRHKFLKRAAPPLWVWLRSSFFVIVGVFLEFFDIHSIAKILFTFAVIQLFSVTLAVFFQELAAGIKRLLEK
ncbi:hypothetical protein WNY59_11595 [Ahrensia kielensis]|uniref:Uncharacterized protein n=1 Tax=Ahrensia kielensis TaxID=76980 RepID=A0ABU9T986_9HYPH